MDFLMYSLVAASLAVLVLAARLAACDLLARMNQHQIDAQDGFTPSMRRWGYVGERRGQ